MLHINRVGFLGGVERVILTLAAGLQRHGFEGRLACPDGELARAAGTARLAVSLCGFVRVRRSLNPLVLGSYPLRLMAGARQVMSVCRSHDIRLIHAHHPVGVIYAAFTQRQLRLPLILHVHEVLPAHWFYRLALRCAARHVSRFICVSEASCALVQTVIGPLGTRAVLIHNGVDHAFAAAAPRRPAALEGRTGPHVGVFGVIEPRKGQDVFLQAAEHVAKIHPDAQFWIVGPLALADKAGFARRLHAQSMRPALHGRVHFVGFQSNVRDWMASMDVVALPSVSHESLSMVLLEAVTLGRPTVGTDVGGGAEIIRDRDTGRIVPPGDAGALADAICELLTPAGAVFGQRAAEDARRRFGGDVFCDRVAVLYKELLGMTGRN